MFLRMEDEHKKIHKLINMIINIKYWCMLKEFCLKLRIPQDQSEFSKSWTQEFAATFVIQKHTLHFYS